MTNLTPSCPACPYRYAWVGWHCLGCDRLTKADPVTRHQLRERVNARDELVATFYRDGDKFNARFCTGG